VFLRRIESVLRRVENTSVSKIPADPREQQRLAKRLGFPAATDFLAAYRHATQQTRAIYDAVLVTK
jgi:glutamine synthetase adenylyltransferase